MVATCSNAGIGLLFFAQLCSAHVALSGLPATYIIFLPQALQPGLSDDGLTGLCIATPGIDFSPLYFQLQPQAS